MPGGQAGAQLKEGLSIPIAQLVENGASRRRCECVEDIGHVQIIGKPGLACQGPATSRGAPSAVCVC